MDSLDGYPPIISRFPNKLNLFQRFLEEGYSWVRDFKTFRSYGQLEIARCMTLDAWSDVGLQEDCVKLHNILSSRHFISLHNKDVLS